MSALNEQEEFEFLYQMEKDAKRGIPPPNPAPVKASMGDVIAGTPVARLAMGAASPLIGAAQLGAHVGDVANRAMGVEPVVSPWIDRKLQEYEAAKQRGMKAAGTEGTDWMGVMGSTIPSAAITKAVPAATTIGKRILSGMGAGGVAAGTQPIADGQEDFWTKKGLQAGVGTLLGGAIPAVQGAVQWGAKAIAPVFDIFRGEKGIENLTRKGLEKNVGKEHVTAVADALTQARQTVPGYKPTAAEALAYTPEGSPVQALQRITARTEGGPSAAFGERALKQQGAIKIAQKTRDILTSDLRKDALALANAGKVEARDVLEGIANIQRQPDLAASDVVSKTLAKVSEKLESLTDKQGVIDARALYTVRKELGNTIKTFSEQTQNWDKRLTGRIEGDIQKGMDWAINNAIRRAQGTGAAGASVSGAGAASSASQDKIDMIYRTHPVSRPARIYAPGVEGPVEPNLLETRAVGFSTPATSAPGRTTASMSQNQQALPGPKAQANVGQLTGQTSGPGPTPTATSGPTIWDQYLSEYSRRSKDIADVLATKKLSLKPTQPTTLEASKNLATSAMPHVALLSRPVVMANALLSHIGKSNIEPKIDLLNQQLLLDPNRMGQFIRGGAPSRNQAMIEALMQQVPAAAGTVSGRAIGGY